MFITGKPNLLRNVKNGFPREVMFGLSPKKVSRNKLNEDGIGNEVRDCLGHWHTHVTYQSV